MKIYTVFFLFFFGLSQGGEILDARTAVNTARTVWDSPKVEAYPLELPLNLSTGKVSHWKAKENSTTKPSKKIIAGPTENKACNKKEKKSITCLKMRRNYRTIFLS